MKMKINGFPFHSFEHIAHVCVVVIFSANRVMCAAEDKNWADSLSSQMCMALIVSHFVCECVFPWLAAPRFKIFRTNGPTHRHTSKRENERQNTGAFQFIQVLDDFCCGIICLFLTHSLRYGCAHIKNHILWNSLMKWIPRREARDRDIRYTQAYTVAQIVLTEWQVLLLPLSPAWLFCQPFYRLQTMAAQLPLCHK